MSPGRSVDRSTIEDACTFSVKGIAVVGTLHRNHYCTCNPDQQQKIIISPKTIIRKFLIVKF